MPRHARTLSQTQTYHIVIKGADSQLLFITQSDYLKYLEILNYYKHECAFQIFAFCLMPNHVHLLIQHSAKANLETIFRRINTTYNSWFNCKYNRTGFLQDGRYFSEPVNDEHYLFNVLQYIHHNPVKAGLEQTLGTTYLWNSIHEYFNNSPTITDISFFLNLIGGREQFLKFCHTAPKENCADIHNFRRRLPDDVALEYLKNECNCNCPADFQKFSMLKQKEYLCLLHDKGISIRQLNRLTGLSKGVIERLLHHSNIQPNS